MDFKNLAPQPILALRKQYPFLCWRRKQGRECSVCYMMIMSDEEYKDGNTIILARVPIYGTTDAGRKFWKRFKAVITENKFRESKIAHALYVLEVNGEIKGLLITHVDDLCWCIMPEYEHNMENILREFSVNKDKMSSMNLGKGLA